MLSVPALYEAIGVYIWRGASEAMTQLGLQLAVAAALGGLARSRLPLDVRCSTQRLAFTPLTVNMKGVVYPNVPGIN